MADYPGDVVGGFVVPTAVQSFAHAWVSTPSDTVPLRTGGKAVVALYVAATGDVVVQMVGVKADNPTTFVAVPAGTTLQIAATYLMAATTATVVALW